jgi:hypothetical protein
VKLAASSKEYMFWPVQGPDGVDLTQYTCDVALMSDDGMSGEPSGADWHAAGGWVGGEASFLFNATWPEGEYRSFIRVHAGAELPVIPAGRVTIGDPG